MNYFHKKHVESETENMSYRFMSSSGFDTNLVFGGALGLRGAYRGVFHFGSLFSRAFLFVTELLLAFFPGSTRRASSCKEFPCEHGLGEKLSEESARFPPLLTQSLTLD